MFSKKVNDILVNSFSAFTLNPIILDGITFVSFTTKTSPSFKKLVNWLKVVSSKESDELTLKSFELSLGFAGFKAINSSGSLKSKSESFINYFQIV